MHGVHSETGKHVRVYTEKTNGSKVWVEVPVYAKAKGVAQGDATATNGGRDHLFTGIRGEVAEVSPRTSRVNIRQRLQYKHTVTCGTPGLCGNQ